MKSTALVIMICFGVASFLLLAGFTVWFSFGFTVYNGHSPIIFTHEEGFALVIRNNNSDFTVVVNNEAFRRSSLSYTITYRPSEMPNQDGTNFAIVSFDFSEGETYEIKYRVERRIAFFDGHRPSEWSSTFYWANGLIWAARPNS